MTTENALVKTKEASAEAKKKTEEFYTSWKRKVIYMLELWSRNSDVDVPKDLSNLIFQFCKHDICWSKIVCGKNIQMINDSTVEFALDDSCLHTIATGALPIQKSNDKYFVYQLQFLSPKRDGSWCIGISEFPVVVNSTNELVSENNNRLLDKVSIGALKNTKVTAFDLNDGRFKANVKETDRVQFLVEFSDETPTDPSKGHGVVHAFHNGETYLGEFFTAIPESFVPAVCTRAHNQCVLEYLEPKRFVDMLKKEREKTTQPPPSPRN
jgi:hypothetical protein